MPAPTPSRDPRPRLRGVLATQQLRRLLRAAAIAAKVPIKERQYQPASLDLRLGDPAYRMLSSFLPEQSAIAQRLTVQDLFQADLVMYELDLRKGAVLEKGHVYLIPLDRKSTRLNSSHDQISYAVFCLKKKTCLTLALY